VRQIARVFTDANLQTPQTTVQVSNEAVRIPNLALSDDAVRWLVLTPLARGDANHPYRVRIAEHPQIEGTLELEPNDKDGIEVAALPATYVGYLHAADDRDRFVFGTEQGDGPVDRAEPAPAPDEVPPSPADPPVDDQPDPLSSFRKTEPAGRSMSALLQWSDEQNDLGLRWSAEGEEAIDFRRSSNQRRVRACGLPADGAGVLEVRAGSLPRPPDVGTPTYSISFQSHDAEGGWEMEPNDDREHADVLQPGATRAGAIEASDDVDSWVFAVETDAMQPRSAALSLEAEGTDLVMRVLDDGGGVVANVDNAAVGGKETLQIDLPEGIYFVEVHWKGGEFCAPYDLSLRE
jgi:hypothetical protein